MTVTSLPSPRRPDAIAEARVHLAAAYRLAVLDELEEGIDNHLTMKVPGQEGRYLILPFGWHWSEASASRLVVYDDDGRTVEGTGTVERSAHCIHTPIHRLAGAAVVLHTHQTWALALNSLQDNRLLPTTQTAAFFEGQVKYNFVKGDITAFLRYRYYGYRRTYRLSLGGSGRKRGLYSLTLRVTRGGRTVVSTLASRRI